MKVFATLLLLLCSGVLYSQITVSNAQSPSALVQGVLLGTGVTATNITYNGSPVNAANPEVNVSYFTQGSTSFPIASGVLLSTGNGNIAVGPNNQPGASDPTGTSIVLDSDLSSIANASVENGVVLEFDFVPQGDTLNFRYMFGSDEYTEYAPPNTSTYNDVFGFFISGPGISGPYTNGAINIAQLPGSTTPVSINNVNPVTNSAYYVDNPNGLVYGNAIQYDGTTTVLTAAASVICGETYHIKLAIANVGDEAVDSGVFLEADSFTSEAVDIAVATITGDTNVVEGCTSASFIFTRSQALDSDTLIVNYTIDGTAIEGTDYNNLPNPIVFLPGVDTMIVTLTPVADGMVEPTESVIITATTITPCDTIVSTGTIYIIDSPFLAINEPDPIVGCPQGVPVTVTTSGGLPPYTYSWSQGSSTTGTDTLVVSSYGFTDFYVTSTDACGFFVTDTVTIDVHQLIFIDSMHSNPSAYCSPTGSVVGYYHGTTGPTTLLWQGPGAGGSYTSNSSGLNSIPPGEFIFSVTNGGCTVVDSVLVSALNPPVITVTGTDTIVKCPSDSVPVYAAATGGVAPYTYAWNYASQTGQHSYVPILVNNTTETYVVVVTDACGLTESDTVSVTLNQTLQIDSLDQVPASACENNGTVIGYVSGTTGQPIYHWEGSGGNPYINGSVLSNLAPGYYYFTITDAVCSVSDSILLTQSPGPSAGLTADVTSGCDPLTVNFSNTSQNATTYHWDFGNGQTANTTDLSSQTQIYSNDAIIMLVASNNGSCPDTAYVSVAIAVCGCTDPNALNYNPLATVSTGNCQYPQPTVVVPNVFTPDGDNINDAFFLTTTNATNIHFIIVNRWGNLMYEGSGLNPVWDGKVAGKDAPAGVYFVNYTVDGLFTTLEGQGIVELFRK